MLDLEFDELYELSINDPVRVWDTFGKIVVWDTPYTDVMDNTCLPIPKWFVGGKINMCYNCLDKHVNDGHGNNIAVIYDSPVTSTTETFTYDQLLDKVSKLSSIFKRKCHINKGDRVLLYFPVIPQCLIAMLACSRIGAIYSPVFGGYPAKEVAYRIQHIQPKLIITSNIGYESNKIVNFKQIIDDAIKISKFKPEFCIVYNRLNSEPAFMNTERDLDWNEEMKTSENCKAEPMESDHPLFIIYTSGTTGEPKGLLMTTGTAVVINKYTMKYIMNMKENETWWMFSDFGWITGQSLMTYAPLLIGCKTILFEGKPVTPENGCEVFRIMNKYKVHSFMAVATIYRIVKHYCSSNDLKITYPDLRAVYTGGEILDDELKNWLSTVFKCHVYNTWGQTELNGIVTSPGLGFGRPEGSNSVFMLGFCPKIMKNEDENDYHDKSIGKLYLQTGLCPNFVSTLYRDDRRFIDTYFTKDLKYYNTKDCGKVLPDKSLVIFGRTDDIIQVYAIRFCGGALEEECLKNEDLINAAVVPMKNNIYGQVPIGFIVKNKQTRTPDKIIIENIINSVTNRFGEEAKFTNAIIVPDVPKTNTGKISRISLTKMLNGEEFEIPPTVTNKEVIREIYNILRLTYTNIILPKDLND